MKVNSWDLFDTLIGRNCGTAARIWETMSHVLDDPTFPSDRRDAERWYQNKKLPYTLADIYKGRSTLGEIEWMYEKGSVYPIKRNVEMLHPINDIIVSDMYLTEEQARELLSIAGIEFSGKMYISPYGKQTGNVWKQIKRDGIEIQMHIGDNQITDIKSPRKHGIHARLADTAMSNLEMEYFKKDATLAYWVKFNRLKHIANEATERLNTIEIQANAPLLWAICHDLAQFSGEKLLFMSRDTQLLKWMFNTLYPFVDTEYLFVSRDTLRNMTHSYSQYINKRLTENVRLCDIASSCGSLKVALPGLTVENPKLYTAIYLPYPFEVDVSGIDLRYMYTNTQIKINNTYLEMLNYADHWHVADVVDEKPVLDQVGEYDMGKVKQYHMILNDMMMSIPERPEGNHQDIALMALQHIQANKDMIGAQFKNHIPMELKKKPSLTFQTGKDPLTVIGAAHNYHWNVLEPWWKSLKASHFTGDIHLMCYNIAPNTLKRLKQVGIQTTRYGAMTHPQVVISRFGDLVPILKALPPDRWVILSDVSDIVFQYNPMHYLANVRKDIVVAHEGVVFSGNHWTDNNLMNSFPKLYDQLKDSYFYNAGSIAGRAGILAQLCDSIYKMCQSNHGARNHDQAAMNWIIRHQPFVDRTLFTGPNDGWCFCAASSIMAKPEDSMNYQGKPVKIVGGWCMVKPGLRTCMFHHYNRDKRIAADVLKIVERRYVRR